MNKIKFMYDVVKTMGDKEIFNGTLKVEEVKDGNNVLNFINEFERNTLDGHMKSRIKTEMDNEGRKLKHESSTNVT